MGRTLLPPGFRFHPTDVELVLYYLKRKIVGRKFHFEAILELNIYKFSPWDLPDKSCLKSKDLEWYFFCPRERKYGSGARMNRATETGYWKTTGRDRLVTYKEKTVGMVKTLVFHEGQAPKGKRTDWVLHEYRIEGLHMEEPIQDSYVLCKVFKKSGPGPRNGAQYGAPFKEEDWEDDVEVCDGPTLVMPLSGLADPINQNCSAVTSIFNLGSTSVQSLAEPGPSSSRLHTNNVPPNNQNCSSAVASIFYPSSTTIESLAEPGPSSSRLHTNDVPPNNLNFSSVVTSIFYPRSTSIQSLAEPDPSLSRLHSDDVPPNNQNYCSVVTSVFDPGSTSVQSLAEPGPSLSGLHTDDVPPNSQNFCSVVTSVFDPESTCIQPSAEPSPYFNEHHSIELLPADDIDHFFASIPENTDSLSIENNEGINNCNQGLDVEMMPNNDIYSALCDLSGGRSNLSGNSVTDHWPNLLFPQDDASYLELDDLMIPVDHSAEDELWRQLL